MKPAYLLCLALAAAGCSRAANIGQTPELTSPRETEEFLAPSCLSESLDPQPLMLLFPDYAPGLY